MERSSRGGGRVWTNLTESHEMRRNGEKFSWDLKVLKIPRGETNPARFLANKCQCCPYLLLSHVVSNFIVTRVIPLHQV